MRGRRVMIVGLVHLIVVLLELEEIGLLLALEVGLALFQCSLRFLLDLRDLGVEGKGFVIGWRRNCRGPVEPLVDHVDCLLGVLRADPRVWSRLARAPRAPVQSQLPLLLSWTFSVGLTFLLFMRSTLIARLRRLRP